MILYGTVTNKDIKLSQHALVEKMWYKEHNGVKMIEISPYTHDWDNAFGGFQEDDDIEKILFHKPYEMGLSLGKHLSEDRWYSSPIDTATEYFQFSPTNWEKQDKLEIISENKNLLTVDKRAFYILAAALIRAVQGEISEDDQQTWISVDEFERRHQEVMSLTYEKADEISLKEAETFELIDERQPDWETPEEYAARGWKWEHFLDLNSMSSSESESEYSSLNDSELNEFREDQY